MQIFGGAKDFCPNSLKLARNVLGDFAYKFFLSKIMKTFFGMTSKKSSCVFLQMLGAVLWNQTRSGAIFAWFSEVLPRFSRILPGFSINQNFLLLHPASYTTG